MSLTLQVNKKMHAGSQSIQEKNLQTNDSIAFEKLSLKKASRRKRRGG
jgi:hypothetical protein